MRVLITRPAAEIDAAATALAAAGHEVAAHPLLVVERLADAKLNLTAAQAFLVAEPEGARALADLVGVRSFPLFADGAATADAALAVGFREVLVGNGAPDLAKLIQSRCRPALGALVYASGVGAPVNLAAILNTMGFSVRQTPVFAVRRAEVLPPDVVNDLKAGRIDAIAFYTPDEARAFVALAGRAGVESTCRTLTAVVASPIVAAPLTAIKFGNTVTATSPDPAAMVAAVDAAAAGRRGKDAERAAKEKAAADKVAAAEAERVQREAAQQEAEAEARDKALASERAANEKAAAERAALERAALDAERREREAADAKATAEAADRARREEAEMSRRIKVAEATAEAEQREAAQRKLEAERREAAERKLEAARIEREREKAERIAREETEARERAEAQARERAAAQAAAADAPPPPDESPPDGSVIDRTTEADSQEKVLGWLFKRRRNGDAAPAPVEEPPADPAPLAPPPSPPPEPVAESAPPATIPAAPAVQMDSLAPLPAATATAAGLNKPARLQTGQPEVTAMPPPDDQPPPPETPTSALSRGPRPAEDDPFAAPPVAKKRPSFLRRVALYLLLIVVLAGALVAGAPWWVPPVRTALQVILPETTTPVPATADPRIDAQAATLATLSSRVAALEQRPAVDDTTTGAGALAALEQRVSALEQAAPAEGTGTPSAEALTGQAQLLTSLTARIATLEAAIGNVSRLDDLARQVAALEKGSADAAGVMALSDRVATLEQTERNQATERTAAAALVLASAQLRAAVESGRPFAIELETVKSMAGRAEVALDAGAFDSFAAKGLPSTDSLRARFPATAAAIVRAGVIPDRSATWLRRTLDRALSVATFRPTGEPTGTTPSAVVARAEARVAEGNLAAAVQELGALEGPALAAGAPWLSEARARVAADQALAGLSTKAIAGLSAAVTP